MQYIKRIADLAACPEALAWLREKQYRTLQEAWDNCPRADWMLWLAARCSGDEPWSDRRRPVVLAACRVARTALHLYEQQYPGNTTPRDTLELFERWGNGATIERGELIQQADAASDAAYAAASYATAASYAASSYATAAAYAASYTAYAAASYVTDAAYAAYADAADAATHVASYTADADDDATMAGLVRSVIPVAPVLP